MSEDDDAPGTEGERIVMISRQRLFAAALATQLEMWREPNVLVLDADDPQLLDMCRQAKPVLLLLDIGGWAQLGLELLSTLTAMLSETAFLVLGDADGDLLAEAIERGASGWLSRDASLDDVHAAAQSVLAGNSAITPADLTDLVNKLWTRPTRSTAGPQLTARELQVLEAMAAGSSALEIATEMGIRVPTVRKHIQNILTKLGLHSQLEAAAYAARRGDQ